MDWSAWVCLGTEEDGVSLVFRLETTIKSYAVLPSVNWLVSYEDMFRSFEEIAQT